MSTPPPMLFPSLKFPGSPVNARQYVEKGTGGAQAMGVLAAVFLLLILTAVTYGLALLALPIGLMVDYFNRKKMMALLRGSAIEVGPDQFPEIYACAQEFSQRLGMKQMPAIYIVEGNVLNAAAARVGSRQVISLVDDVVDACLRSGDPRSLGFLIAHEMAHHALGHTSRFQMLLSQSLKRLSRLNELSCDAVARALIGDGQIAARALIVLLTGPQLVPHVNTAALLRQAEEVANDKLTVQAERRLSHPLLLRRVHRMLR